MPKFIYVKFPGRNQTIFGLINRAVVSISHLDDPWDSYPVQGPYTLHDVWSGYRVWGLGLGPIHFLFMLRYGQAN